MRRCWNAGFFGRCGKRVLDTLIWVAVSRSRFSCGPTFATWRAPGRVCCVHWRRIAPPRFGAICHLRNELLALQSVASSLSPWPCETRCSAAFQQRNYSFFFAATPACVPFPDTPPDGGGGGAPHAAKLSGEVCPRALTEAHIPSRRHGSSPSPTRLDRASSPPRDSSACRARQQQRDERRPQCVRSCHPRSRQRTCR
jgi:hypothetical protein